MQDWSATDLFVPVTGWSRAPEGDRHFLCSPGGRVETDRLGATLFGLLPATVDVLRQGLAAAGLFPHPPLLEAYLRSLCQAGILRREGRNPVPASGPLPAEAAAPALSLAVVVVSYNGARFIEPCLASVLAQGDPPVEVVVVDNASADDTAARVERGFPTVRLIRNRRNVHYAAAVNRGVAATRSEWVVILNQDLTLDPGFTRALAERLAAEAEPSSVAALVPMLRLAQLPAFLNGLGNLVQKGDWGADQYFGLLDFGQFDALAEVGSACFGAVVVKRSAWQRTRGLDPGYGSFYEDADWSFRARLAGYRLLAVPRARAYHAFGGSYPEGAKLALVVKNRQRFVLRSFSGRIRLGFLRANLKHDGKLILRALRHGRLHQAVPVLLGYLKLAGQLPGILAYCWFRRGRVTRARIEGFFAPTGELAKAANEFGEPRVDASVVREYYLPPRLPLPARRHG